MPLSPGARVGVYEIVSPLGAGGMGEVYRARDTRLNRDVAIKTMHASVAQDPERIARFEREAQLLASLNHPNIAAIHGLQEADGSTYLVLEFVDGRTLAELIAGARGLQPPGAAPGSQDPGLQLDEALSFAKGIADALAAAHDRGIIHRDLKPGNVMVTAEGQVKVLDFGLGKAIEGDASSSQQPGTSPASPTMTLAGTQAGIILGTAGYMSPEQARGRNADKRSDVWAFGCVLFEMLAGRRAFEGEDITDTLAAIVRGEPDWHALPAATPPAIRALIERCLTKDRAQRLPDMSVVRFILNEPSSIAAGGLATTTGAAAPAAGRPLKLSAVVVLVAAAVIVTGLAMRFWWRGPTAAETGVVQLSIALPDGDEISDPKVAPLAISPDGTAVVYSAVHDGRMQLFVRRLDEKEPTALPGTDGGQSPFFKPDGRWIGFFADSKLKKIALSGTALQELADAPVGRGGAWSDDDTIYFAAVNIGGLSKVAASGGPVTEVTALDRGAGEISHRWPVLLPDGRTLLFSVWTGPGPDEHRIDRLNLSDGTREVAVRRVEDPASVVGGLLITGGRLDRPQAVPWQAHGDLTDVEPVELPFESQPGAEGASLYSVSATGTFAYAHAVRGSARLVWIDRAGEVTRLAVPERRFMAALISPKGDRAAVQISGGTEEIWLLDLATSSLTPLVTTGGSSQSPVWSHDGRYIYYRGTRNGFRNVYRKAVDSAAPEERLTSKADVVQTPFDVTSDGAWLVYGETGHGGGDLWKLPLGANGGDPVPLVVTEYYEIFARVSPDNRWLAYVSGATGGGEVWVRRLDGTDSPHRVSRDGGVSPAWSRDGQRLYFVGADRMLVVDLSGDTFSQPRVVASGRFVPSQNANTNYDVASDGRLLQIQPVEEAKPLTRIEIILNGMGLLRKQ